MSPFASIALGLGLVFVDISVDGVDLVPDVIGWLFAAGGAHALSTRHRAYAAGRALALANAVLAVLQYVAWGRAAGTVLALLVTLGFLGFVLAVCAGLIATDDARTARSANAIRWLQVAATTLAAIVMVGMGDTASLGMGADPGAWWPLAVGALVLGVGSNLWLIVLLLSLRQRDSVRASEGEPA